MKNTTTNYGGHLRCGGRSHATKAIRTREIERLKVKYRAILSKNKALKTENNKRIFHKKSNKIIMAPEFGKKGVDRKLTLAANIDDKTG